MVGALGAGVATGAASLAGGGDWKAALAAGASTALGFVIYGGTHVATGSQPPQS
jgi:hypothetical protein